MDKCEVSDRGAVDAGAVPIGLTGPPCTPDLQTPGGGEGSRTPERPSSLAGATGETPRPARDPGRVRGRPESPITCRGDRVDKGFFQGEGLMNRDGEMG